MFKWNAINIKLLALILENIHTSTQIVYYLSDNIATQSDKLKFITNRVFLWNFNIFFFIVHQMQYFDSLSMDGAKAFLKRNKKRLNRFNFI